MKQQSPTRFAAISLLIAGSLVTTPTFALNERSGMPREPRSVRAICAKESQGYHLPYRGWVTRNRLAFNTCLREHVHEIWPG
ncbi:hypothetical protein [Bradyrhizobium sp. 2TAF24]|uniref:hypothetical protein n=1 Tax=Bradyrhizobium sp. 2TAF24 TaxID=3233011 RepID=UPI003F9247E4